MKKIIYILVIFIILGGAITSYFVFSNKDNSNNNTTIIQKKDIVIDQRIVIDNYTFNKLRIDLDTNKIYLYGSTSNTKNSDFFTLVLYLYDKDNNLITIIHTPVDHNDFINYGYITIINNGETLDNVASFHVEYNYKIGYDFD